jgi:murein DD-endopeptidase MepM/ murein hydrolase activator NlpD
MLKILKQLGLGLSKFFLAITTLFGKGLWQFFFKKLLVPSYKGFLFTHKKIKQIFWGLSLQPTDQPGKSKKYLVHIIITIIFCLSVANNLATRNTYAEELSKNSILAKIFVSASEEEIVERPIFKDQIKSNQKNETILGQLNAVESKKPTLETPSETVNNNLALLSSSGEALINSNTSPFVENTTNGSITTATTQTYEVQSGDTLSSIASRFSLSVNTILWENNLTLKSFLKPGMKLTILPTDGVSYSVKNGDTVGSIARKFNTSTDKILSYNNLGDGATIKISQHLIIPDAKPLYNAVAVVNTPNSAKNVFSKAATPSGGKYVWPSTSRRITQYFSWRHTGLDIGAKAGTPIYSLAAGRVELAGWSSGYGYNIVVDHGSGIKTRYGHSRKLYVKVGDQVGAGDVLGEVGSTGYSTGPHIHLEFKINGTKVNPLSYL